MEILDAGYPGQAIGVYWFVYMKPEILPDPIRCATETQQETLSVEQTGQLRLHHPDLSTQFKMALDVFKIVDLLEEGSKLVDCGRNRILGQLKLPHLHTPLPSHTSGLKQVRLGTGPAGSEIVGRLPELCLSGTHIALSTPGIRQGSSTSLTIYRHPIRFRR